MRRIGDTMAAPQATTTRGAWLARRARPLLAVYALLLAVALLAPTSTVQSDLVWHLVRMVQAFLPAPWITYTRAEVVMNAVIVAPVSFLGTWALPRLRWQDWAAYGFLGSSAVEITQGLLLPNRQSSFSDIVANTAGALMGAVVARVLLSRKRAGEPVPASGPGTSGEG